MVRIIKVLRVLLAGWSFRGQRAKGMAKGTNGKKRTKKRGPSAVGFFAFALCLHPARTPFFLCLDSRFS